MIQNYSQFICWDLRTVIEDGKEVVKKLPISPVTRYPIDHLNPTNWMTFEQACSHGLRVGFVLTENDPFFFFDMDKCLQANGEWSPQAIEIYSRFNGAAAEVSQSGSGLHIMGVCDQSRTANLRRKFNGWLEFYTAGRFVAFGGGQWSGDFAKDCTDIILSIVPERPVNETEIMTNGPVAEWTGPLDDDELISKAMNARSIAAAFGNRATFAQLFMGDAAALSQLFPSPTGDVFDRSSADASLMMHLAFWTGKDGARMDRIFRRSALMRDKYENRAQYRSDTIQNSVTACRKVYDVPRPVPVALSNSGEVIGNQPVVSGEIMDISTQIKYFAGCVYIVDAHRCYTPRGDFWRPEQFKTFYGGYEFLISGDSAKPTRNAFEAFTENRVHAFPKVRSTIFRPNLLPGQIVGDCVNVYMPQTIKRVQGDPSKFLHLLQMQIPNERDRQIVLNYMAALVQNIGVKFSWAVVLQGTPGNGKTFLVKCLEKAIGEKYVHVPAAEDLTNAFNSYLENKVLICVEEIHMNGRREVLDTLKPLITNERIEVQAKGIDKRMIDNLSNWFFCTNYKDAVYKTEDDRRYSIIFTAQQKKADIERDMPGDYFVQLWDWATKADGFAIIAEYLHTFPVDPELNPAGLCRWAPNTSTTHEAIKSSLGVIEQEISEAIENGEVGFRNGWVSSEKLDQLFKEKRVKCGPNKKNEIMGMLGYVVGCRPSRAIMEEMGKRPTLYVRKEIFHRSTELSLEDYMNAQGYQSAANGMPGM